MNEYKFQIGDRVKVIKSGSGFGSDSIGNVYVIVDYGPYKPKYNILGYKVKDLEGNIKINFSFNDFVGEDSFELLDTVKLLIDDLSQLDEKIKEKENGGIKI